MIEFAEYVIDFSDEINGTADEIVNEFLAREARPLETPEQIEDHLKGLGFVREKDDNWMRYYPTGDSNELEICCSGYDTSFFMIDSGGAMWTVYATPGNIEQFIKFFKDESK